MGVGADLSTERTLSAAMKSPNAFVGPLALPEKRDSDRGGSAIRIRARLQACRNALERIRLQALDVGIEVSPRADRRPSPYLWVDRRIRERASQLRSQRNVHGIPQKALCSQ